MNSSFKIFFVDDKKTVLVKGKFADFPQYNDDLKKKIINTSKNPTFKEAKKALREKDLFILTFAEENPFKPANIEGIWNNESYNYFIEKLTNRKIFDAKFKFYVKRVKAYPKFKGIKYSEILKKTLEDTWGPIYNEIKDELKLNKLEESKVIYDKKKEEIETNLKKWNEKNLNIICNNCLEKDFPGPRFVCSECNNYNLCQKCEKLLIKEQIHDREHVLIQINKPLNDENDSIYKYNNFFGQKDQTLQIANSSFKIQFTIINTGENNLNGCYILPIRYGDENLGCKPYTISEPLERNQRITVELLIRRSPNLKIGTFHGYFRMFTPKGIPFGNILHIKTVIGE